jgi:hypothetical protein
MAIISHSRRVSPLRSTELYGVPLIQTGFFVSLEVAAVLQRRERVQMPNGLYGMNRVLNARRVTIAAAP